MTENENLNESPVLQTEAEISPEISEDAPVPQTEPEQPKRTRRRRIIPEEAPPETADQTQSEEPAAGSEPAPEAPATPRTAERVIPIDLRRTVQTDADKARNDLLDLLESQRSKRILTGTIQGVEGGPETDSRSLAVIYYGDYKILIPAEEAVTPPEDFRGRPPEDVLHQLLTRRLGAEVDYIVRGVDAEAHIAVASRLEAMRAKRREYYFSTDRDGNYTIHADLCAEARVVSVIRAGIFVDVFGLEVYIPLSELSYQRMMDAASAFQPGQRILVRILEVNRARGYEVQVSASVKQAGENPFEKAIRKYSVGNRYVGTVSLVNTTGVFVALDGGIDCLCNYPKRGRPPRGARATVKILGINHETNRIWGAITHIATPR